MKIYSLIAGAVALIGSFITVGWFAYDAGKDAEKARTAAQLEEYRDNQQLLVEKLAKAQATERIVVKTKIRTIRAAVDPTGCLDTEIPENVLSQLR